MKMSKKKYLYFVEKSYGDDLGRGKSIPAKRRHKRQMSVRLRRLIKKLYPSYE